MVHGQDRLLHNDCSDIEIEFFILLLLFIRLCYSSGQDIRVARIQYCHGGASVQFSASSSQLNLWVEISTAVNPPKSHGETSSLGKSYSQELGL